MKTLLHIVGSPRGAASKSEMIASKFKESYLALNPDAQIDVLNLWEEEIPAFDGNKAAAKMTFFGAGALEGEIKTAWDEVLSVTERFTRADDYLITVPMWNGGIPWPLKHYIDTVTQPGLTFGFGADGYFPLLSNKRACVIYTSGVFSPALPSAFGVDFQASYMNWWLQFVGIKDVHPILYLSNVMSPDPEGQKEQALTAVQEIVDQHFATASAVLSE